MTEEYLLITFLKKLFSVAIFVFGVVVCVIAVQHFIEWKFNTLKREQTRLSDFSPTLTNKLKDLECMTMNIYREAGNQSFEGKVAVAQVTMNRVRDGRFGKGVCGVVYEQNRMYGNIVCQFSWTCVGRLRIKPLQDTQWLESAEVAKRVMFEGFSLPSLKDALYFHADYVKPRWNKTRVAKIGNHIFYKE